MQHNHETKIVSVDFNPLLGQAFLSFDAFSDSQPDEGAQFWFTGPYFELNRSPKEHVIFKMRNAVLLKILSRAREVHVRELGKDEQVRWEYIIRLRDRNENLKAVA